MLHLQKEVYFDIIIIGGYNMGKEKLNLKMQLVITIGRQYGAGGTTVGKMLAEDLGIPYYDQEILKMASDSSAVNEEFFRENDELVSRPNLLQILTGNKFEMSKPEIGKNIVSPDNLFKFQSEVIKELAKKESCVIIGRCANWLLQSEHKNKVLRVFLYADYDARVKRIMEKDKIDRKDASNQIKIRDRQREEHYFHFTGREQVDLDNYDIMINTSTINFEETLETIESFLKIRGFLD